MTVTNEDILAMARQVGFYLSQENKSNYQYKVLPIASEEKIIELARLIERKVNDLRTSNETVDKPQPI